MKHYEKVQKQVGDAQKLLLLFFLKTCAGHSLEMVKFET